MSTRADCGINLGTETFALNLMTATGRAKVSEFEFENAQVDFIFQDINLCPSTLWYIVIDFAYHEN